MKIRIISCRVVHEKEGCFQPTAWLRYSQDKHQTTQHNKNKQRNYPCLVVWPGNELVYSEKKQLSEPTPLTAGNYAQHGYANETREREKNSDVKASSNTVHKQLNRNMAATVKCLVNIKLNSDE